jgi:hypothetical protein
MCVRSCVGRLALLLIANCLASLILRCITRRRTHRVGVAGLEALLMRLVSENFTSRRKRTSGNKSMCATKYIQVLHDRRARVTSGIDVKGRCVGSQPIHIHAQGKCCGIGSVTESLESWRVQYLYVFTYLCTPTQYKSYYIYW